MRLLLEAGFVGILNVLAGALVGYILGRTMGVDFIHMQRME